MKGREFATDDVAVKLAFPMQGKFIQIPLHWLLKIIEESTEKSKDKHIIYTTDEKQ